MSYLRESATRVVNTSTAPGTATTDVESARMIARKIFEIYDRDRTGAIEPYEIGPMMTDAYKTINKSFTPSKADIDSYIKVLDRNGDGRVTLQDVEQVVMRFLLGEDYGNSRAVAQRVLGGRTFKNPTVQAHIEQSRRIFAQFDTDYSGYIEEREVGPILEKTYAAMGMVFKPTPEDVRSYMSLADTDRDGRISQEEFEDVVIRSLAARGIKIE